MMLLNSFISELSVFTPLWMSVLSWFFNHAWLLLNRFIIAERSSYPGLKPIVA